MTDDRIAALESELAKAQAEADRWRSDYRELQALHSSVAARVMGSDYELTQAKAELAEISYFVSPGAGRALSAMEIIKELNSTSTYTETLEEEIDKIKTELAALRAECERLRVDATVKAGRLLYIADNINDNVAVRFGLEAREDEIIAVMKDAGWPIDARKAQP